MKCYRNHYVLYFFLHYEHVAYKNLQSSDKTVMIIFVKFKNIVNTYPATSYYIRKEWNVFISKWKFISSNNSTI